MPSAPNSLAPSKIPYKITIDICSADVVSASSLDLPHLNYIVGTNPTGLTTFDMNRDGRNDLVVVGDSSIYVLFGNANGTFQNPITYAGGVGGKSVTAADVNGDGVTEWGWDDDELAR